MRSFAVRFENDPPDYGRLVLAQDGPRFLVGRAPHDPPHINPAFWFEFGEAGPFIVSVYFSDAEGWADTYRTTQGA